MVSTNDQLTLQPTFVSPSSTKEKGVEYLVLFIGESSTNHLSDTLRLLVKAIPEIPQLGNNLELKIMATTVPSFQS